MLVSAGGDWYCNYGDHGDDGANQSGDINGDMNYVIYSM